MRAASSAAQQLCQGLLRSVRGAPDHFLLCEASTTPAALLSSGTPAQTRLWCSSSTGFAAPASTPSLADRARGKLAAAKEKVKEKARVAEQVAVEVQKQRAASKAQRAAASSMTATTALQGQGQEAATEAPVTAPAHHVPGKADAWFGARFCNPWHTWEQRTLKDVLQWQRERKALGHSMDGWLEGIAHPTKEDFARAFPLNPVDWQAVANPVADAIQAVWVGHATVLVQQAGLHFITDPCFSLRCSPVQFAGPKRVVDAAFTPQDVPAGQPPLDFVLLSHNHFDHLDAPSVKMMHAKYGDQLTWYVPLGVKAWFTSRGLRNVVELDWWQEVQHKDSQARITFVPAQHWSQRGLTDRCHTLWGGYVVQTKQPHPQTFYFAGDTGYCDVFKEIGERLGPMDLSAIPTGAYEPRWFMRPQHVNAEEGLQVHLDVQSRRSLAIHCCTWSLTDEPLDEPPVRLAKEIQARGLDADEFVTLQHGEMLVAREGRTLNAPRLLGPRRHESEARARAQQQQQQQEGAGSSQHSQL